MTMRTLTALAAFAAAAALAGTASADEAHVNLAGLSPAAAYAKIESAARAVCMPQSDKVYSIYLTSSCVADTVAATLAKIADPALIQYSQARKTFLVASN